MAGWSIEYRMDGGIPVFYPSAAQFRNFDQFISKIEKQDGHKAGICKVRTCAYTKAGARALHAHMHTRASVCALFCCSLRAILVVDMLSPFLLALVPRLGARAHVPPARWCRRKGGRPASRTTTSTLTEWWSRAQSPS